jgi:mono/diheme cytochrome c family protein
MRFLLGVVVGLAAMPAVALVMAWLGVFPMHAKAVAPGWEEAFAQYALKRAVERRAPHVSNPLPQTDETLLAGLKVFRNACAGCHGDAGTTSDYGGSFYPPVPQFAKNPPHLADWQLFYVIKNGVRYSGMSAWDGQWRNGVSDDRMWKVATFLSRLDSLPPAVEAEWRKPQQ